MDENEINIRYLNYGKICWLWTHSVLHQDWPVELQAKMVLPPITLDQYYIVEDKGFPVAYCSWAMVNKKVEEKYILDPTNIDPSDWNCGDRLWFVDWISPISPRYTWSLQRTLAKRFPKKIARSIRVKKGQTAARVATFAGRDLSKSESRKIRRKYFRDLVQALSDNPKRDED